MKILTVEDNKDMRDVLINFLALPNVEIETARDGETAIQKIESDYQPDLVLLDLHLPGMREEGIFRILRRFVEKADAVFTKPFSATGLLVKITSMVLVAGESGQEVGR